MKLLITLLLIPICTYAQNDHDDYLLSIHEFETGSTQYIFGNRVVLRDGPSKESPSMDTLDAGMEIKIIDKTESYGNYGGVEWPWYKVKAGKKTGYILSGLISFNNVACTKGIYLVSMRKTEDKAYARYRYLKNDGNVLEGETELETWMFTAEVKDDPGLETIDDVLYISYFADACGVNGGGIYLFNDGEKLIEAIRLNSVSEAGLFWHHEKLIFPNDEEGVSGRIIFERESGQYMDEEMEWVEIQTTIFPLQWEDRKLIPEVPPMRNCE